MENKIDYWRTLMPINIEIDYSDYSPGDLPVGFSYGVVRDDAGVMTIEEEDYPNLYYYVQDDCLTYKYYEEVFGPRTDYHGLTGSPGSLSGTNAELSVIFSNPLSNFSDGLDEFCFELGVGFRGKDSLLSWVGGLLESKWSAGSWTTQWKLSVVDVLGITKTEHDYTTDFTRYADNNELVVVVEGDSVTVTFNGIKKASAEIDFLGEGLCILWMKTFTRTGVTLTPMSVTKKFSAYSLKTGRLAPIKEEETQFVAPPHNGNTDIFVPVHSLLEQNKLKQIGPDAWQFTEETLVEPVENFRPFLASSGAIITARRQTLPGAKNKICRYKW
jgi:hypothetical protein